MITTKIFTILSSMIRGKYMVNVVIRIHFTRNNKALKYRWAGLGSATAPLSGECISGDDWSLCKRGQRRRVLRKFEAHRTFRTIST